MSEFSRKFNEQLRSIRTGKELETLHDDQGKFAGIKYFNPGCTIFSYFGQRVTEWQSVAGRITAKLVKGEIIEIPRRSQAFFIRCYQRFLSDERNNRDVRIADLERLQNIDLVIEYI